jgi:tRNA A37 threonylcarbamoyladenosine synthetase subunit TsaC/SUA5/YrdC
MDMLLNAGPLHNALAELAHAHGTPVFGSSANQSLSGSKYRVRDIEPGILAAADIAIDHDTCRDANDQGLSSTIIDFRDFSVVRAGCRFSEISAFLTERFGISMRET